MKTVLVGVILFLIGFSAHLLVDNRKLESEIVSQEARIVQLRIQNKLQLVPEPSKQVLMYVKPCAGKSVYLGLWCKEDNSNGTIYQESHGRDSVNVSDVTGDVVITGNTVTKPEPKKDSKTMVILEGKP